MAIVMPRQCNVPQLNSTQLRLSEDIFHKPLDHISFACIFKPASDLPLYGGTLLSSRPTKTCGVRDIYVYQDSEWHQYNQTVMWRLLKRIAVWSKSTESGTLVQLKTLNLCHTTHINELCYILKCNVLMYNWNQMMIEYDWIFITAYVVSDLFLSYVMCNRNKIFLFKTVFVHLKLKLVKVELFKSKFWEMNRS